MRLRYPILIGLFGALLLVMSQQRLEAATTFRSELNPQGQTLQLRFVLKSDKKIARSITPKFPPFKEFDVLSGPNTGTSLSINNGRRQYESSWTWLLQPKIKGTIVIGSANVVFDGKRFRTKSKKYNASAKTAPAGDELFLIAEVSNSKPVVGEMLLVKLKLYYNTDISGYDVGELESSAGFLVEKLDDIRNPETTVEQFRGRDWQTAVLKEVVMFPTHEGELTIEPIQGSFRLPVKSRQRRRSAFDDFFGNDPFRRSESRMLQSERLKIQVQPLPPGAPAGFSGIVGSYSLKAAPDKRKIKAGEAITLNAHISGQGNLKLLPDLRPELGSGLELYDTQKEFSLQRNHQVSGRCQQQTLIVAREAGRLQIGALSLVFYDPAQHEYRRIQAGPWTIEVEESDRSMISGVTPLLGRAENVRSYGADIRHILDTPEVLRKTALPLHRRNTWRGSLFALALCPLIAAGIGRNRDKRLAHPIRNRRRKAAARATKKLDQARREFAEKQATRGLRLLDEALCGYLADQLNLSSAGLMLAELAQELLAKSQISEETAGTLIEFRQKLDYARYGGSSDDGSQLQQEALQLLKALRAELERKVV